jgi:acetamidase/formamidase
MTRHQLDPSPSTTADVFSRDLPPVLTVDPGDTIVLRSLNASGYLQPQTFSGEKVPTMASKRRSGHCLTGPIAVRGAMPVAGSILYLPVAVPGALLSIGDGHAAQGDGEVAGTAIECGMTTGLQLELVPERPVPGVHAETPAGQITFGFSPDLNAAMGDALDAMLTWLQASYGVGKATALAMASPVLDLRITQVANQSWGVHALLPAGAIS